MFNGFKYEVIGRKFLSDSKTKKRGEFKDVTFFTNSWKEANKMAKKFNSKIIRANY